MDEIKTFFSNPYTWMGSLGIALVVGVFWFKMNTAASNMALVIGVLMLAVSVGLHPLMHSHPLFVRILLMIATASVLGLAGYGVLWTPRSVLGVMATINGAVKPHGAVIGGIPWSPKYADLRLSIVNNSTLDYQDLDLVIQCDHPIAMAGQVSGSADVAFSLHHAPTVTAQWVNLGLKTRVDMLVVPIATQLGYRLRCDALPRNSRIEIVFAVVSMNDNASNADVDKLLCVNFSDGTAFWLGSDKHTDSVFGPRPSVNSVLVKGQFRGSNLDNRIVKELKPADWVGDSIPKLQEQLRQQLKQP